MRREKLVGLLLSRLLVSRLLVSRLLLSRLLVDRTLGLGFLSVYTGMDSVIFKQRK